MGEIQTAGRVVVGTDGSSTARRATDWASEVAASRSVPLLIVSVVSPHSTLAWMAASTAELQAEAGQLLEAEATRIRDARPGLAVETATLVGSPSETLVAATRDAELVVVGARGHSASLAIRNLGGLSDAVATHAEGPVAIVPEGSGEHEGPIVVGVDDAPEARAAIRLAFNIARRTRRPLVALHAYHLVVSRSRYYNKPINTLEAELAAAVDEILTPIAADYPDVTWERRVVRHHPVWGLVDASMTASAIVLGSRGHGGLAGMLLGSTSREVLRNAECPVFIVRASQ